VDFEIGSQFAVAGEPGEHPVHDTVTNQYRHLNFFQYECSLEVRVPRLKLPDGSVRQVSPPWAGKLSGFTLLFEAFVLDMCREMTFSGVAQVCGLSKHRVMSICERYVDTAVAAADFSEVRRLAVDETSRTKVQDYVMLFADAERRAVLFVAEGNEAATVEGFEANLCLHGGKPTQIEAVSMDMWPALIKGVTEHFPNAQITFDKFHVIAPASTAVDATRRIEQKIDPSIKGLRWALLKDRSKLRTEQRADLDELVAHMTTKRTARAWLYREQLRDIMTRRQPNVVRTLLKQWCTNVMRSKAEPMKEVAAMIRNHFEGILAWVTTRRTNGFLKAINGLL
jgi:transposase